MMKKHIKKTATAVLLSSITCVYAFEQPSEEVLKARAEWTKKHFEQEGVPAPDGGVKVIPQEKLSNYEINKEEIIKGNNDIKKYGYIRKPSPSVDRLMTLDITAKRQLTAHSNDYNPESTYLKPTINELKLAYTPIDVRSISDNYFGAAPYLTYIKGEGWVGVVQLFSKKGIGNCSYYENNVRLSHGAVNISKEDARNDVNGKITTVDVVGLPESGFTYTVEWYDQTFFRTLECANKNFSNDIKNSIIELAKEIDNG